MRKGPNPKIFMLMAVGAVLIGGILTLTGYSNMSSAAAELRKVQGQVKNSATLQKELADSQASLQDCASRLKHLEFGVQDYAYIPTMLSELDKLGRASGINVVGVRPIPKPAATKKTAGDTESTKKKNYDEIDVEVKGEGSYRSVINFVEALGKFPKIVAARTVELTPKTSPGQTSALLDVTIDLRAYVFPVDQTPPTPTNTAMVSGGTHEG
ncbi:MAG TPA: type 4a pilus biogenesis protein PilO [Fimbriimonadaceae bacterium]|nr:type 4a pilus biogenesis protein PilO [Fimbriimonadaceae bacterium]